MARDRYVSEGATGTQQRRSARFTSDGVGGAGPGDRRRRADDEEFDRHRDRKLRRREEKKAQKEARIAAHERWVAERRRAQAEAKVKRDARRARQEYHNAQRKLKGADTTTRTSVVSDTTAARGASDQVSQRRKRERVNENQSPPNTATTTTAPAATTKRPEFDREVSRKAESSAVPAASSGDEGEAALSPPPPSSSGLQSPPTSGTHAISPAVSEATRRCVNKLTNTNVVPLTEEIAALCSGQVAGASRAVVLDSLLYQIDHLCRMSAGPLSETGTLPFAGLLRSLQILFGSQAGAEIVENVCMKLHHHILSANEEAADNLVTVLAQLYLLYGVDATLMSSLLRALIHHGAAAISAGDDAGSPGSSLSTAALAAASCGLTLLRACGEKMLKETPVEMEKTLQVAQRAAASMGDVVGGARFKALVSVMADVVGGHTRKARRTVTEADAPVEAMLDALVEVIPGSAGKKGGKRTLRRVVQTASTLCGLTWTQVTQPEKPPRWFVPGVMAANDADDEQQLQDEESEASDSERSSSSSESEADARAERVRRIRAEEKALAGQHMNTEHKREVFRLMSTAADDLECFNALMQRDPTYTRFHDVCEVLLQCCAQEKTINPFYMQVLERFCSSKRACVKTLQFALWDRFKSIRLEAVDLTGYLNLASLITSMIEHGTFTLSLLRGLDLEETNKTIGLFTRVLLLRMLLQLSPERLTEVFLGGNGLSIDRTMSGTTAFRTALRKIIENYFENEAVAKRWLPMFYDVVAVGTPFDTRPRVSRAGRAHAATAAGGQLGENAMYATASLTAPVSAEFDDNEGDRLTPEQRLQLFIRRVHVARKALR